MVERDHRGHAAIAQSAQHGTITLQRVLVPGIGCRLDAAPLHRHAMRVLSTFGGAVEVFFPAAAPPVAGQARYPLCMTFLFPFPPLVIRIVAFYLVRGSGRPP